jgi:hypothetical protein
LIERDHGVTQRAQLGHPRQKAQAEAGPAMHQQRVGLQYRIAPVQIRLGRERAAMAAGIGRGEKPGRAIERSMRHEPTTERKAGADRTHLETMAGDA